MENKIKSQQMTKFDKELQDLIFSKLKEDLVKRYDQMHLPEFDLYCHDEFPTGQWMIVDIMTSDDKIEQEKTYEI